MNKEVNNSYEEIYQIVRAIPEGKVCTYGIIAQLMGSGFSARVVGYALNQVVLEDQVPAHRVVNRNGILTGRHYFNPPDQTQGLLEREGHKIIDHKIVDFKGVLWDPRTAEDFL
ncbi:MAG TPA: MGMT family protein [Faecalibacter sp.]